MDLATIYFVNGDILTVHEGQLITPITKCEQNGEVFASMSKPVVLHSHTQNGLIPSLLDAFYVGDYFFIDDMQNIVYSVNSVVKVKID